MNNTPVQLFDEHGVATHSKPRDQINKQTDLCFSIHVLIFTPSKELILSKIPTPMNYDEPDAGKYKSTATSLLRINESPLEAAKRAIKEELLIIEQTPLLLGREFGIFESGTKRWMDIYYLINSENGLPYSEYHTNNLYYENRLILTEEISMFPERFATPFLFIWNKYNQQFPF